MNRIRRKLMILTVALGAGTLFQVYTPGGGCLQYGAQIGLTSFDFCAVLNCEPGSFFNFCSPVQLFVDCP